MSSNSVCNHTRDKQIGLLLRGRPIFLLLVWLQTELDSTQSYYHYKLFVRSSLFGTRFKYTAIKITWKWLERRSLKKIRASTGFEPMTSAIPVRCSTNWAMKPHIGSKVNFIEFMFSYIHIYYFIYISKDNMVECLIWVRDVFFSRMISS